MDDATPRAVLVDPGDNGLAIGRSLTRRRVPVTALCAAEQSWAGRVRGVELARLPDLPGGAPDWIGAIAALAARGPIVLIACSDVAVELLASTDLPDGVSTVGAASEAHLSLTDKASLYELAGRVGVRAPWWRTVSTERDLEEVTGNADFPCIAKPALSHLWRPLFGDDRTLVTERVSELEAFVRPALEAGLDMIVSEHVPGPDSALEGAVVVRAPDGRVTLSYGRRKIRQHPLGYGAGAVHESAHVPESMAIAERLLEAVGYVGIAAAEVKRHAETGERVLIEVNTRVPQSFALGDVCGADASWRLYASFAGIPLGPQPEPRDGVRIVVPLLEWRALRDLRARRELRLRSLLHDYRGVRDVGLLDPRDPLPLVSFLRRAWKARRRRR